MTETTNDQRVQRYVDVAADAMNLDVRRAHDQAVAIEVGGRFRALADAEIRSAKADALRLAAALYPARMQLGTQDWLHACADAVEADL